MSFIKNSKEKSCENNIPEEDEENYDDEENEGRCYEYFNAEQLDIWEQQATDELRYKGIFKPLPVFHFEQYTDRDIKMLIEELEYELEERQRQRELPPSPVPEDEGFEDPSVDEEDEDWLNDENFIIHLNRPGYKKVSYSTAKEDEYKVYDARTLTPSEIARIIYRQNHDELLEINN